MSSLLRRLLISLAAAALLTLIPQPASASADGVETGGNVIACTDEWCGH